LAKIKAEYTRKAIHVLSALAALGFPAFFVSHLPVFVLCVFFSLVIILSKSAGLLQSVHDVGRQSVGGYLFPVSLYGQFLLYTFLKIPDLFYAPVAVLAISDPAAGIIGMEWARRRSFPNGKSVGGSLAFLLTSFAAVLITLAIIHRALTLQYAIASLVVALVSAIVEALSPFGSDNLLVPVAVFLTLVVCHTG